MKYNRIVIHSLATIVPELIPEITQLDESEEIVRRDMSEFPKYVKGTGVYNTNLQPLPKMNDSDLGFEQGSRSGTVKQLGFTRINTNIANSVNAMFNRMSSTQDLRFDRHKNGESNLFYGSAIPNEENRYFKGDEQEAEIAMLQTNWDVKGTKPEKLYVGLQLNSKR